MTKTIFVIILSYMAIQISGQEVVTDLEYNSQQNIRFNREKEFAPKADRGSGSLSLPFFDDFSRYSLPTDDPEIPLDWQRWEDDQVFINSTFPIEPPTIGVATLDGLDRTGYPYDFNNDGSEHIYCDTMTSLPIDLFGLGASNNVYLLFYHQAQGLGNDPDIEDSLFLEFKIGPDNWIQKWAIPGSQLTEFQQVFVEVWDADFGNFFFVDDFQFRFRNKSEGTGNLDHWNLDYVLLAEDIDPENFQIQELAIMDPVNSILNSSRTSMPWTHFLNNPSAYMFAGNYTLMERNFGSTDFNFQSGFQVEYTDDDDDLEWDFPNAFSNTGSNANSIIETPVAINGDPNFFVFDDQVNDTCAVFDVKFYHEISDATPQNDTTLLKQRFTNYYAYDDGSAEKAWYMNVSGSRVAIKHQSVIPDTLIGLLIQFTPFRENAEDEIFLLRAYGESDIGGGPGEELNENFASHSPVYYQEDYNEFTYYPYDSPIPVDGVFYCGFVQSSSSKLNVGLDVNTDTNGFNAYVGIGSFGDWGNSGVSGTLMIRPVLKSGKSANNVGVAELYQNEWTIFPNPVSDVLRINTELNNFNLTIYDISGRVVLNESSVTDKMSIDVNDLSQGTYIIEIMNQSQGVLSRKKFIIK